MTESAPATEKKSFFSGVMAFFFLSFGYVAIQMLLTPVRIRLLTGLLTKEEYGVLNLVIMTVSFLAVVVSLGTFEFLLRKLPGKSTSYQHSVIKLCIKLVGALTILAAVVGIGILCYLFRDHPQLLWTDWLACGLALVFYTHLLQRAYILVSTGDLLRFRLTQFLYSDIWFVPLVLLYISIRLDIHQILWVWTCWLILIAVATVRFIPYKKVWRARDPEVTVKGVVRFGLPLMPLLFGEWLFRLGDRYFILWFRDIQEVAEYTLCMNIALIAYMICNNVIGIIIAKFNHLVNGMHEEGEFEVWNSETLRRLFGIMLRYSWIFSIITAVIFFINGEEVIGILADKKFASVASLLPWAAPVSLFFLLYTIFSRTLIALEMNKWVGALTIGGGIVNVALNLILVPKMGKEGAALATVISLLLLAIFSAVLIKLPRWLLWTEIKPFRLMIHTVVTVAAFYAARRFIDLRSFGHAVLGSDVVTWLVVLVAGGLCSMLVAVALGLFQKKDILFAFKQDKVGES